MRLAGVAMRIGRAPGQANLEENSPGLPPALNRNAAGLEQAPVARVPMLHCISGAEMGAKHFPVPGEGLAAFDPARLDLLQRVVEEAWKELLRRSDVAAMSDERAKLTRELMAHRVMARALRGEWDPQRLKEHALWGF